MTRSHIERDVLFRKLIEQVSKGKFDQQQVLAELCWAVVDLSAKVKALALTLVRRRRIETPTNRLDRLPEQANFGDEELHELLLVGHQRQRAIDRRHVDFVAVLFACRVPFRVARNSPSSSFLAARVA